MLVLSLSLGFGGLKLSWRFSPLVLSHGFPSCIKWSSFLRCSLLQSHSHSTSHTDPTRDRTTASLWSALCTGAGHIAASAARNNLSRVACGGKWGGWRVVLEICYRLLYWEFWSGVHINIRGQVCLRKMSRKLNLSVIYYISNVHIIAYHNILATHK